MVNRLSCLFIIIVAFFLNISESPFYFHLVLLGVRTLRNVFIPMYAAGSVF